MTRLLICCAAIATIWAADQSESAAQSGTTGSYQSITAPGATSGYPGITSRAIQSSGIQVPQIQAPVPGSGGIVNGQLRTPSVTNGITGGQGSSSRAFSSPYNNGGTNYNGVPQGNVAPYGGGGYGPTGGAFGGGTYQGSGTAIRDGGAVNGGAVYGNNGVINGGTVYGNNGIVNGGTVYGNGTVGREVYNSPVQSYSAPAVAAPIAPAAPTNVVQSAPYQSVLSAPIAPSSSSYVADALYGGSFIGSNYGYGAAPQFSAPVINSAPVFIPGQSFGAVGASVGAIAPVVAASPSRNVFFGLRGLVFDRDFEDDLFITRNPSGDILRSTDADTGTLGGLEFFLGTRGSNGSGFEARYWGLFADEASATVTGSSFATYITDLQSLYWPTTGEDVRTVVDRATSNTIVRDNEIHNIEFNMLRRGGCYTTRRGRSASFELLHGFRWFEFDEEFRWDVVGATAPTSLRFDNSVQNTLLGYQLGGRSEICLGKRLRLQAGTKAGLFNNRARVSQSVANPAGTYATIGVGGPDYNFEDAKNDVAFLGEFNVGTALRLGKASRITTGYRVIGVSGLALGPNQFSNFNALDAIRDVQSNGSLLLHGAVFGIEFCR